MLFVVVLENGVKKIKPLTADAGAGNPVGSLLHTYKKSNPSGYLYCDGSTFDQTKYPLLYAYLGSNVLPDYRECVEVGAEQNTTDSIATHDVYTEGQFKDDQLQEHDHAQYLKSESGRNLVTSEYTGTNGWKVTDDGAIVQDKGVIAYAVGSTGRKGTTTHGKQKAVFVYIKATSGLSENAQDNVINTLNEQRSYSTEEVNTGKKWIDGKEIYSKVIENPANNVPFLSDVAEVVEYRLKRTYDGENLNSFVYEDGNASANSVLLFLENGYLRIISQSSGFTSVMKWVYVEYTKTT